MARHALPDIADLWNERTRAKYLEDCAESGADVRYSADATGINRVAYASACNKLTGEARDRFARANPYHRFYKPDVDVVAAVLAGDFTMCTVLQAADKYVNAATWKSAIHKRIATGRLSLISVDAMPPLYRIEPSRYYDERDTEVLLESTKAGVRNAMRRVLDRAALARRRLDDLEVGEMALDLARGAQTLEEFEGAAIHVHFLVRGRLGRANPYREFDDEVVWICNRVVPGSAKFVRAIATVACARELANATLEPICDAMALAGTCPTVDLVDALSAYVTETRPGSRVVAVPGRKEMLQGRLRYVDCILRQRPLIVKKPENEDSDTE
jgi:hypothetical protein